MPVLHFKLGLLPLQKKCETPAQQLSSVWIHFVKCSKNKILHITETVITDILLMEACCKSLLWYTLQ